MSAWSCSAAPPASRRTRCSTRSTRCARLNAGGAADAGGTASALLSEAARGREAGRVGLCSGYGFCLAAAAQRDLLWLVPCEPSLLRRLGPAARRRRRLPPSASRRPLDAADIVKQRMQVASSARLGVADAARAIVAAGGVHGLWRGYLASLAVWGRFRAPALRSTGTKAWLGGDGAATRRASTWRPASRPARSPPSSAAARLRAHADAGRRRGASAGIVDAAARARRGWPGRPLARRARPRALARAGWDRPSPGGRSIRRRRQVISASRWLLRLEFDATSSHTAEPLRDRVEAGACRRLRAARPSRGRAAGR